MNYWYVNLNKSKFIEFFRNKNENAIYNIICCWKRHVYIICVISEWKYKTITYNIIYLQLLTNYKKRIQA